MKRVINLTAAQAARRLVKMIAPALLPAERRDYLRKVYRVCRVLVESQQPSNLIRLLDPGKN